ncbi:hypothetical protein CC1G_09801 [Coprinopsis cinerea okayama7|uniref:Uncharacterized protein n=1 Tax=Coprinopsis cinerea (strain Okayama-7 / 130 / ATCC MYA-4618 / FGSC 9003) TaxID=240176 RepID=A8NMA1_COPC7|nr:hypothetical protein CC1G_09801 [Coprinopsis cinerea okayama7\|eukprot:XP_001834874.1 hypothetical protein CC1G_09801 [Coprinopsis cinerea okayama7\
MFANQLTAFVLASALSLKGAMAGPLASQQPPFPGGGTTCSSTNTITQTGFYDPLCSVVVTVTEAPQATCTSTSTITVTLPFDGAVPNAFPTPAPTASVVPRGADDCSVVVTVTVPGPGDGPHGPKGGFTTCPFTNTVTQTLAPTPADPDCSVVVTVTERLPRPTHF